MKRGSDSEIEIGNERRESHNVNIIVVVHNDEKLVCEKEA